MQTDYCLLCLHVWYKDVDAMRYIPVLCSMIRSRQESKIIMIEENSAALPQTDLSRRVLII